MNLEQIGWLYNTVLRYCGPSRRPFSLIEKVVLRQLLYLPLCVATAAASICWHKSTYVSDKNIHLPRFIKY